jgi:hypothetical protein
MKNVLLYYLNKIMLKQIFTILICSLFLCKNANAQKLTGTWEGDIGGFEFLQINIQQVGESICGYTWDYTYANKNDYCKAYFSGSHNKSNDTWYFSGYSFMENSGSHVLMQLIVEVYFERGDLYMKGYCRTSPGNMFPAGEPNEIKLKKVSSAPRMMTQTMKDCVKEMELKQNPKKDKIKTPAVPKPVTPKPVTPKPPVVIKKDTAKKPVAPKVEPKPIVKKPEPLKTVPPVITPKKDTIKKIVTPPKVDKPKMPDVVLPKQIKGRQNKEISRIVVNDRKIKLEVYDNGTIDGDTVSIFYNGKMIMDHKRLTANGLSIDLSLDENTNIHSIVMFADNLGSIPPNTALIVFTTPAGKRYELFSSSTLQQNAELIFEYKPK